MTQRKIRDSHWHIYSFYDKAGRDFFAAADAARKAQGLASVNILSTPTYENLGPAQNIAAALYKLHDPTAFAYGGLAYTAMPAVLPQAKGFDSLTQYRELMDIGFDGIKFLETKPSEMKAFGVSVTDPYYEGIFEACEEEGTPIMWHVADPEAFWDINRVSRRLVELGWFYGDGTYPSLGEIYGQVCEVLKRHPRLTVTFAHFFFRSGYPEQLEALFDAYPNVTVDLPPGTEMYTDFLERREYYREFFTRFSGRILFGSDTQIDGEYDEDFYAGLRDAVCRFITTGDDIRIATKDTRGLDLPSEVSERILYGNFERIAGKTPKKINLAALREYFEKYSPYFTDPEMAKLLKAELDKS